MAINQERIKREAKELLDKFADALASVEKEAKGINIGVDREEFERIENKNNEKDIDEEFKQALLKNAPESDEDFVIVERGNWK